MTDFTVNLAGVPIRIHGLYEETKDFCKDYLCEEKEAFSIWVKPEHIAAEQEKSNQSHLLEGEKPVIYAKPYLETLAVYRQIAEKIIDFDVLLFHGSAIAVDGEVYLFTAKSGTGKSTHTRLWKEYFGDRACMVNDDKPLLKVTDTEVLACGTPWDGKHRLSSPVSLPVRALVILDRDSYNHIEKISVWEAFPMLLQQSYRSDDPDQMPRILSLLEKICHSTTLYHLGCNMDPEASRIAYEGIQKERIEGK